LFVTFHILHFTTGQLNPDFIPGSASHNLIAGFGWWPVVVAYVVAMGALCLHLYHGVWSGFQTLGLNHPGYNRWRRPIAFLIAGVIFLGFISVPVSVLIGILK
jgi:succinate dehydrogenase / fumarate reductase cytochrome b subunit